MGNHYCRPRDGNTHLQTEDVVYVDALKKHADRIGQKHGEPCLDIASEHCRHGMMRWNVCTDPGVSHLEDPLRASGSISTGMLDVNADGEVSLEDLHQGLWLATGGRYLIENPHPDTSKQHFRNLQAAFQEVVKEDEAEQYEDLSSDELEEDSENDDSGDSTDGRKTSKEIWPPAGLTKQIPLKNALGCGNPVGELICAAIPGCEASQLEDPLRVQGRIKTGLINVNADGKVTMQDCADALFLTHPVDMPEVPDTSRDAFAKLQGTHKKMLEQKEGTKRLSRITKTEQMHGQVAGRGFGKVKEQLGTAMQATTIGGVQSRNRGVANPIKPMSARARNRQSVLMDDYFMPEAENNKV